jgi:hypothetical protein
MGVEVLHVHDDQGSVVAAEIWRRGSAEQEAKRVGRTVGHGDLTHERLLA